MGQAITTLAEGYMNAGSYTLTWDASNQVSGMCLVRAETAGFISTQKLLLRQCCFWQLLWIITPMAANVALRSSLSLDF